MFAVPSWSSPPLWARAPRARSLLPFMGLRCFGSGRAVSSSSAPLRLPRRHTVWTLACLPPRTMGKGAIATTTALSAPSFRCARPAPTAWTAARACQERRPLRRRGTPLVLAARTSTRMASWPLTVPTTAQANRCHRRRPAQPPCVPALASARRRASTPTQTTLGHRDPSTLPTQHRTPDAGVSARRKTSLGSASALLTWAAQWISPSRLRKPHDYPVRASVLCALKWEPPLANGWRLHIFWMAAAYSILGSLCGGCAC